MPTTLLLDIDGVVNAPRPGWPAPSRRVRQRFEFGQVRLELTITWSSELVTELDRLRDDFDVELTWLTSWALGGTSAIEQLTELLGGLRGGRVEPMPPGAEVWRWKPQVAERHAVDAGGPLIWIDDIEVGRLTPAAHRSIQRTPSLLLGPDSQSGLSPADVAAIRGFCENVRVSPDAR